MAEAPYYIASCSCGKDSLAMVIRLIEERKPLDEIVFYDTGMEFNAIYTNWVLLKQFAKTHGVVCTRLRPKCPFIYNMLERLVNVGRENEHKGYSWCGGLCRWGTTEKQHTIDTYVRQHANTVQYIGIAFDEPARLNKTYKKKVLFPLAEWEMTEADCLVFCRKRAINWNEPSSQTATGYIDLYDILDRVSCWCCTNKNLWELRNIWHYLPEYWAKLRDLQVNNQRPFKKDRSIFELEEAFKHGYRPKHRTKH